MNEITKFQPQEQDLPLNDSGKVVLDDIYTAADPRPFSEVLSALDYVIPSQAKPGFQQLFADYRRQSGEQHLNVLDLGSSFGVNAALLRCDLSMDDYYQLYSEDDVQEMTREQLVQRDRKHFDATVVDHELEMVGFDIASSALEYALDAGLIADAVNANLECDEATPQQAETLAAADCIISTGCIGYVSEVTIEKILAACAPQRPWMRHCILRMFPSNTLQEMLQDHGYQVDIDDHPIAQRRFASAQEQEAILNRLHEENVDTSGMEEQGWIYANVLTAVAEH